MAAPDASIAAYSIAGALASRRRRRRSAPSRRQIQVGRRALRARPCHRRLMRILVLSLTVVGYTPFKPGDDRRQPALATPCTEVYANSFEDGSADWLTWTNG